MCHSVLEDWSICVGNTCTLGHSYLFSCVEKKHYKKWLTLTGKECVCVRNKLPFMESLIKSRKPRIFSGVIISWYLYIYHTSELKLLLGVYFKCKDLWAFLLLPMRVSKDDDHSFRVKICQEFYPTNDIMYGWYEHVKRMPQKREVQTSADRK